jgi:hypothetical protein
VRCTRPVSMRRRGELARYVGTSTSVNGGIHRWDVSLTSGRRSSCCVGQATSSSRVPLALFPWRRAFAASRAQYREPGTGASAENSRAAAPKKSQTAVRKNTDPWRGRSNGLRRGRLA